MIHSRAKCSFIAAIAVAGAFSAAAQATSYACNAGESIQACMARMAREQSQNSNRNYGGSNNNYGNNYGNNYNNNRYGSGNNYNNNYGNNNNNSGNRSASRGQCNWQSAVPYVQVMRTRSGTRCGTRDSFEMDIRNGSNQRLKIVVFLKDNQGRWIKSADGTFDDGAPPGWTQNYYTCHFGGYYKVIATTLNEFLANHCTYPDYYGH